MNMRYYKMANSNILSNVEVVEYIRKSEGFSNKFINSFTSALFSSVVGVLVGMELWKSMQKYNIFLKLVLAVLTVVTLYLLLYCLLKTVLNFFNKIFKEKNTGEMSSKSDYFYTEFQPQIVMGLSLAERILTEHAPYDDKDYQDSLNNIYIHQCLYYFRKLFDDITVNKIFSEDGTNDRVLKEIGYDVFYDTCSAVILQLKRLEAKYSTELNFKKIISNGMSNIVDKNRVESEVKKRENILQTIKNVLKCYEHMLSEN